MSFTVAFESAMFPSVVLFCTATFELVQMKWHLFLSPGTPSSNRFPESLTLNLSNNSGSLTGRLSSLSVHSSEGGGDRETEGSDTEEGSSDWDSWDEEEEVGQQ